MESLTQNVREKMNLVPQLIEELQIKSKTEMSTGACVRRKCVLFCNVYFV